VKRYCIPKANANFVAKMEDVLEVYERPFNKKRPVVCVDEGKKELRSTPRGSIPAKPGRDKREDYEYQREGSANIFMALEPLAGKRSVKITDRRTKLDFARFLKFLSDEEYAEAEMIVLVTDNLNTHKPACLYEAFEPEEARRLVERFEWHYTPEHGSWLNAAEIELSAMQRGCLDRRLTREVLEAQVPVWVDARNAFEGRVNWQFRNADARVKLRRLYPVLK
jgi:transposase